jgi:hypothetical protein
MKKVCLFFCFQLTVFFSVAQEVKIYGEISVGKRKIRGVLVSIFEDGLPYKKTYTNKKGRFFEDISNQKDYIILFYKRGYKIQGYKVSNRLETSTQKIPIDITLESNKGRFDSLLVHSDVLNSLPSEISSSFLKDIFDQTKSSEPRYTDENAQRVLVENAEKEEKRFENFKQKSTTRMIGDEQYDITETQIGLDFYEMLVSKKKTKRYTKNGKPITSVTYNFETIRRYDGVLKSIREVEKIEKYKPLQSK